MSNCRIFDQEHGAPPMRSTLSSLSRSFLAGAFLSHFLLCVAPHFHQRFDQIVHRLALFGLAPHPYERLDKVVHGFLFFSHAAFYPFCPHSSPGFRATRLRSASHRALVEFLAHVLEEICLGLGRILADLARLRQSERSNAMRSEIAFVVNPRDEFAARGVLGVT